MRRPLKNKKTSKPDTRYNSERIGHFIGNLMLDGKRSTAERIVYDAFAEIEKETKQDPKEIFEKALENIAPTMEVRSRRVGGANYQVPIEVRPERRRSLAARWLLQATRGKKGSAMSHRLAQELIAASNGEGDAVKRKEQTHAMAEANKAFAHFANARKRKKVKI